MWKKIENLEAIADIIPGDVITLKPGNAEAEFIVQKIHTGYVNVIHANGISVLKVFPEKDLISGKWYLKE